MDTLLQIAIPRPLQTLLSYHSEHAVPAGSRVLVPLGRGKITGVVIASQKAPTAPNPAYTIKDILRIIDSTPLLDTHVLELLQWASHYYHHPVGEVVFSALPVALRDDKPLPITEYWQLLPTDDDTASLLKRAKRQLELHQWLDHLGRPASTTEIRQQFGPGWQGYLQGLIDKGLVKPAEKPEISRAPPKPGASTGTQLKLTPQQRDCLQQCQLWSEASKPLPILLHGVTGSGKTEIYLRLIEPVIASGRQVLVLVPEIGLTPQLLHRFQSFFPEQTIAALHSGLNNTERLEGWMQARDKEASIIIGTRSAVFTACADLGMIIVDEEHDLSFKQQEGFRYHGRDLAIKRAHMLSIPIVLGSATPALETLHNADQGRYHYIRLDQRPGASRPPTLEVQDIRGFKLQAGLSEQSLQAIRTTLKRNEQALVFINRRGFAPVLLCPACGWQAECPSCSSNMTFHTRGSRLICHHCGTDRPANQHCPDCSSRQLTTQGQGTERIELMLKQQFTDTTVLRIDRDSISRKGALQQQLETIHNTERLLLVGTQMLAKGHDFPNLTLVVIVDIDQALLSAEYHALERFGQLLTQVAGRAGRSHKTGTVILQTTQPQHPVLLTLLQHGYLPFARQLLEERKRWNYPPYGYQALIRANAREPDAALDILSDIRMILLSQNSGITLLGPIPAPMEKKAGRFRAQLLILSKNRQIRHHSLKILTEQAKKLSNKKGTRWSIDIDPVELT